MLLNELFDLLDSTRRLGFGLDGHLRACVRAPTTSCAATRRRTEEKRTAAQHAAECDKRAAQQNPEHDRANVRVTEMSSTFELLALVVSFRLMAARKPALRRARNDDALRLCVDGQHDTRHVVRLLCERAL